jgi:hypothetical protein
MTTSPAQFKIAEPGPVTGASRSAIRGYNELPENGSGELLDSRLYSQTPS